MSESYNPPVPEQDDPPAPGNPPMTSNPPAQDTCACPPPVSDGDSSGGTQQPALISADIGAGSSAIKADVDALGHDLADVSIGLDAIKPALALVDGLTCGDSNGSATSSAPIISAALDADLSGVQANVDVLGHDTIELGAVDSVLGLVDSNLGLVDGGLGLADGLLCDVV